MGLSRLYLASSALRTEGSGAFSDSNGPPGIAFIAKNVMTMMMNTVTIASNMRFRAYFHMRVSSPPFLSKR